jgi:hypothetical protein
MRAFDTATLKEATRFAAGAGVMQIQLRESRFGVRPGEIDFKPAPFLQLLISHYLSIAH